MNLLFYLTLLAGTQATLSECNPLIKGLSNMACSNHIAGADPIACTDPTCSPRSITKIPSSNPNLDIKVKYARNVAKNNKIVTLNQALAHRNSTNLKNQGTVTDIKTPALLLVLFGAIMTSSF